MAKKLAALAASAAPVAGGLIATPAFAEQSNTDGVYTVTVSNEPATMEVGELVSFDVVVSSNSGGACPSTATIFADSSPEVALGPLSQPFLGCGFVHEITASAEAVGSGNVAIHWEAEGGRTPPKITVPFTIEVVEADVIAPVVTIANPVDGATYTESEAAGDFEPVFSCVDEPGGSGIASCVQSGFSTALGTHTMTVTGTDNAGNQATASVTYTVVPDPPQYTFSGFYEPVDMGLVNVVKGGRTVPLKFNIFEDSTEIVDPVLVDFAVANSDQCDGSLGTDDVEFTTTGGTSLRYDFEDGQFVQNWKTPRGSGCYEVTASAGGASISALFQTK